MIKLIVSDFDGTLLPYSETLVSSETKYLIEKLLDSGAVFGISSGRTYNELLELLPEYSDRIYYTCCDGAMTVKCGKTVYSRKIEVSDIDLFFKNRVADFSFILHGAFENYSFGKLPEEAVRYNCKPVKGIYEIKDKIYKVTSFGGKVVLPEYCGIRTHWDGGASCMAQYVNRYCNKGTALSDLQMRLMLTKYDTAILGDRGNDVCMVKGASVSYCIGDSCSELSKVCTNFADSGNAALESIFSKIKC